MALQFVRRFLRGTVVVGPHHFRLLYVGMAGVALKKVDDRVANTLDCLQKLPLPAGVGIWTTSDYAHNMLPLVRLFSYCLLVVVLLIGPYARHVQACPQLASALHSQWKIETQQGVSWLITPCGERFFSLGVNVLNGGYPSRIHEGRLSY